MARETNSIATVWDIDNSNGYRVKYNTSLEDEACCMKPILSGTNAYWRNTIIPTSYSSNNMYVKYGDIKFAPVYTGGFSTTYTKSGTVSSALYKWVKISNLGVNIMGANGAIVENSPYTMSAYTSAASIPIPYTVCSGDRVSFVTSAATFNVSNMSGTSNSGLLGGIVLSGSVTQLTSSTFIITGANATLNPNFILYGINGEVVIPSGNTPTPTPTNRAVTINLSQIYTTYIYGIRVGGLKICTGTTAAAARAAAQSSTALSITSQLSQYTLTGYTKYNSGAIIKSETLYIPKNAYLCVSAVSTVYPQVRTTSTGAWVRCGWYSGSTSTTAGTTYVYDYTFVLPPSQNEFYMIAGLGQSGGLEPLN